MAELALLSSSIHHVWTISRTSTRGVGGAPNYSPSDAFETFPYPKLSSELRTVGEYLHGYRNDLMHSRQIGLTSTYNLMFDEDCSDPDIEGLRKVHRDIDKIVVRDYDWADLIVEGLDHGFHKVGSHARYTIGPAVQQKVLDRLLELNQARYAEEVANGLHNKRGGKAKGGKAKGGTQASLFEEIGG
ncbi:hypothetical protein ACQP2F_04715 [Actinoplanes sp. CA-030573]|uniref:hypothetical protein n=1 Tax=Actinoplanes sp. CA-030573 TaxID=3239898 RepID=UPI003D8A02B5